MLPVRAEGRTWRPYAILAAQGFGRDINARVMSHRTIGLCLGAAVSSSVSCVHGGPVRMSAAHGCGVAARSTAPLVVEWDATARGQLESLRARHVVAVRYTGCELEVLP